MVPLDLSTHIACQNTWLHCSETALVMRDEANPVLAVCSGISLLHGTAQHLHFSRTVCSCHHRLFLIAISVDDTTMPLVPLALRLLCHDHGSCGCNTGMEQFATTDHFATTII